ncbi:MAG: hypothetical protein NTZ26_13530 [Candidatus Aminicenantes bacterium]|nr:hypothetical protein [Candidatus Aminicenantes bacterium]
MKRWKIGAAVLAAVIIITSCTPNVVPNGYQLLGRREVNFGIDRDSIDVDRAAGPLRQLLITAKDLPGEVRKVREVTFRYRKLNNAVRRAVIELWGK